MDFKNLMTFIDVAEMRSFTRAAEKLGYSQSTISFQIKQLETEIGSPLFERFHHTVVLTERGREVLDYAHQIRKLTLELKENMQDETSPAGTIRLAMADSLCNSLLRENFSSFRQQYPGITLKIIAAGTDEMLQLMDHNEVDAILTLDSHVYHTEYVTVREEKVETHFVAGTGHPLCQKDSVSMEALIREPFLLTEKGMSYRRLMDEKLAGMSMEINPALEIGSADLICSLVEQNIGISFLPDYVTDQKVREGKLKYLNVDDFKVEIWKQLLHHRNKWVSPQMKLVLQYCVQKEFSAR